MSKKMHPLVTAGSPHPLGATLTGDTINFAVVSRQAQSIVLVLEYLGESSTASYELPLDPHRNKTGDIWHIGVPRTAKTVRYGYRVHGRSDPARGLVFSPAKVLLDPYCPQLAPRAWGAASSYGVAPLCLAAEPAVFDWQGDRPLKIPAADTIIYELHVRGFSRHGSSAVSAPGTFQGIVDKIPYLKELGITAVELLPVTEWDETDTRFYHPESGELLLNYWGYNPLSFFALKSGFASRPDDHLNEFKKMVRSLHQAGIEVILDMVFNHTGELDYSGTTSCFRGLDNQIYYLLDDLTGEYLNFSGCGNTVSCNHPVVLTLLLDALHYWVREMHVDGFRFDLAAIFNRDRQGVVQENTALVEMIADDPLLRDCKIIAEAWDASGLYQVGSFSQDPRWAEWNGRFRDDVRLFMAGSEDSVRKVATRIAGSSDLYGSGGRSPLNSINYVACHDGFTLYDLVSYNTKSNLGNGEQNRDGENHNLSWNSGYEGDAGCPAEIMQLRWRRIKSFAALLLLSQGIPMLAAGDEFGKTQRGNNNGWCQDNELSWLDWSLAEKNKGLLRFFKFCIALRKKHRVFRRSSFFEPAGTPAGTSTEISWQALRPGSQDWSASCHALAFLLHGAGAASGNNCDFMVMLNGNRSDSAHFVIPEIPSGNGHVNWFSIINSAAPSPHDITDISQAAAIRPGSTMVVPRMGLIVLQSGDDRENLQQNRQQ